jgi:hypothetical protein
MCYSSARSPTHMKTLRPTAMAGEAASPCGHARCETALPSVRSPALSFGLRAPTKPTGKDAMMRRGGAAPEFEHLKQRVRNNRLLSARWADGHTTAPATPPAVEAPELLHCGRRCGFPKHGGEVPARPDRVEPWQDGPSIRAGSRARVIPYATGSSNRNRNGAPRPAPNAPLVRRRWRHHVMSRRSRHAAAW